ncbi:hypothetical protein KKH15_02090 [Patescibacteria group bacterium]|nr:hypothetical protein [Patescibacteria group bacterium]
MCMSILATIISCVAALIAHWMSGDVLLWFGGLYIFIIVCWAVLVAFVMKVDGRDVYECGVSQDTLQKETELLIDSAIFYNPMTWPVGLLLLDLRLAIVGGAVVGFMIAPITGIPIAPLLVPAVAAVIAMVRPKR